MRRSPAADLATLRIIGRHVDAFLTDWPALLANLDQWRGGNAWPAGAHGQPGGKGGHTDLSDRLHYDANGNLVGDPCDRIASELGHGLELMRQGMSIIRAQMTRHLADPTPTSLCRHGDCPAGNVATSVIRGVPRCSACKAFWYASASSPEDGGGRRERSRPDEDPTKPAEQQQQRQAVA